MPGTGLPFAHRDQAPGRRVEPPVELHAPILSLVQCGGFRYLKRCHPRPRTAKQHRRHCLVQPQSLYSHRQMIEKHKPLCTDAQAFRKERLPIRVKQQRNKLRLCLWGNIAIWKLSSIGQPLEARDLEDYYVVMGGEAPQSAAWVARLCCLFRFDGQGFEKLGSESKGSRAW
jgi:hypothetical protein